MAIASKIGFGKGFGESVRFASNNCAKRYPMECRRRWTLRPIDSQFLRVGQTQPRHATRPATVCRVIRMHGSPPHTSEADCRSPCHIADLSRFGAPVYPVGIYWRQGRFVPHLTNCSSSLAGQLQSDGKYLAAVRSRFLRVMPDDVDAWVLREGARGSVSWKQRLREWVRNELGPRAVL